MKKEKTKVLIDSLFELQKDFTKEELVEKLDKNGMTVSDSEKLINLLLNIGMIEEIKENLYSVK